jgi:hypothetical protein
MAKRGNTRPDALAQGLGWFSIGLGLVEILAPHALARGLNLRGNERLLASYGAREVVTGIGILASRDPEPWIWGRVAGDALDIGTLATGLDDRHDRREGAGLALAAVLGVTVLDLLCASGLRARRHARAALPDYSRRSGLPRPPEAMRGAARDFVVPADMRTPEALRPWVPAA